MFTRKKIGLCVPNLKPSQRNYFLLMESQKHIKNIDIIIFFEEFSIPYVYTEFSAMQMNEVWNFTGPLITYSINTLSQIINAPSPSQKFLYLWDLEWTFADVFNFNQISNLLRKNDVSVICRCPEHKEIIENCWNIKVPLVTDNFENIFNNDLILKYTNEKTFLI